MFSAAKVIRGERYNIGAPAKTDFVNIYICKDVSKREFGVLLKHEQAHIWCEHNHRFVKGMDNLTWQIAADMEIARNIYTDEDEAIINAKFSRIKGGLLKDSIEGLPEDLLLAEDIYDWLIENKNDKSFENAMSDIIESLQEGEEKKISNEEIKQIIKDVKKYIEENARSQVAEEKAKISIKEIERRKPSLIHEVDVALRYRTERNPSFRRQARREIYSNVLQKGKITEKRPPLVEIFIDCSGSFTPDKTAIARTKLEMLLKKYNSSIRHDVWFFGSGKISDTYFEGGDTPYYLIYEHLLKTKPKIAVIVTDNDQVSEGVHIIEKQKTLCIPVGCNETEIAKKIGGIDVSW